MMESLSLGCPNHFWDSPGIPEENPEKILAQQGDQTPRSGLTIMTGTSTYI